MKKNVQAIICNTNFPNSVDLFIDRMNKEKILSICTIEDKSQTGIWTLPKWMKKDDIVFFYYAQNAKYNINKIEKELIEKKLMCSKYKKQIDKARELYEKYGGKIYGIAQVKSTPFYTEGRAVPESKLRYLADIKKYHLLKNPIDKSSFDKKIQIKRQGAFTTVGSEEYKLLFNLLDENTKDRFADYNICPFPYSKTTLKNYLSLNQKYNRNYQDEASFRSYFVDYLLKDLSDDRVLFSECRCRKDGKTNYIDNVIKVNGIYIPVEVKLNINAERDICSQVSKYCKVDDVWTSESIDLKKKYHNNKCMIIDNTNGIYLFDSSLRGDKKIRILVDIEDINSKSIISRIKRIISKETKNIRY